MRFFLVAMALCFSAACGDSNCKRTDWSGAYLIEYTTVSGDCGTIPNRLEQVSDGAAISANNCTFDLSDWSADNCTLQTRQRCVDVVADLETETTSITTQQDGDGDLITGNVTVVERVDSLDIEVCAGEYTITATRQN